MAAYDEDEINSWFHMPFTEESKLLTYDILRITDEDGVRDYHGVVTVVPDSAAEKVIDHLSGKRLHGKQLFPSPYFDRQPNSAVEEDEECRRDNLSITKNPQ